MLKTSIKTFNIKNAIGRKIVATIHIPGVDILKNHCTVVFHGMFSSRNGPKHIALAEYFQQKWFSILRFDFSGCGQSDGKIEETTISGRVGDGVAVCDYLKRSGFTSVSFIGSSLGGVVALVIASRYGEKYNIKSVVTLAVPARPYELIKKLSLSRWEKNGYILLEGIKLKWNFVTDALKYNLLDEVSKVKIPVMLIHGTNDTTVSPLESQMIFSKLVTHKKLILLDGADHSLLNKSSYINIITSQSFNWIKRFADAST